MTQGHHETYAQPALAPIVRLTAPAHDHTVIDGARLDDLERGRA